jgi:hypothetical protein
MKLMHKSKRRAFHKRNTSDDAASTLRTLNMDLYEALRSSQVNLKRIWPYYPSATFYNLQHKDVVWYFTALKNMSGIFILGNHIKSNYWLGFRLNNTKHFADIMTVERLIIKNPKERKNILKEKYKFYDNIFAQGQMLYFCNVISTEDFLVSSSNDDALKRIILFNVDLFQSVI